MKSLALATLVAMTQLRLRGRPWSWLANGVSAFAVGALDPDDIRHHVARTWDVEEPDSEIDYELLLSEQYLVDRVLIPRSKLLVVGSGAGRDLVAYAQHGFQVTGIEPAPNAARLSERALRDRGLPGTVLCGFVKEVTLESTYDAMVFSYFCYTYIPTSERRVEVLRRLRPSLASGGTIALTYNLRSRRVLTPLSRIGAWLGRSSWRPEHGDVVYLTGRPSAPFGVEHLFSDDEIISEAARAGFHATSHGQVAEARIVTLRATGA